MCGDGRIAIVESDNLVCLPTRHRELVGDDTHVRSNLCSEDRLQLYEGLRRQKGVYDSGTLEVGLQQVLA